MGFIDSIPWVIPRNPGLVQPCVLTHCTNKLIQIAPIHPAPWAIKIDRQATAYYTSRSFLRDAASICGSLAQLVEQRTFNPLVACSSHARPTRVRARINVPQPESERRVVSSVGRAADS